MDTRLSLEQLAARFDSLLDLTESERVRSLDNGALHAEDRRRLEGMLHADAARSLGFLDEPALMHAIALDGQFEREVDPAGLIGQQFGAFRLVRLLGQGGMATVFLGQRTGGDFEQVVAVKLLRRGLYSSVEQRLFRRERMLLANLEHPGIARLIDGGVSDAGIPFLVMEFVEGLRLDLHVAEHRLDLRQRLDLFAQVCRAVDAAHRSLVVHRDIKPSNILVTPEGAPKLLDFGIAKLLPEDEDATSTHTMTAVLTPRYAAPEQMSGDRITTATDVYSLGVVLHELLTGARPAERERQRPSSVIDGGTPEQPSVLPLPVAQLRNALRGDLDNIILQALSAEPERRYPTAAALLADIEAFLGGRPVRASPPSRWHAARKFVQRNRLLVATSTVLSLAVLASLGGVLWQTQATKDEARRANAVRDFVLDLFRTAEESQPRDVRASPEDVIEQGVARVLGDASLPPEVREEMLGVLSGVALSIGSRAQADLLTGKRMVLADQLYASSDERWITAKRLRAEFLIQQDRGADAVALLLPLEDALLRRGDAVAVETLLSLGVAMGRKEGFSDDVHAALLRKVREMALGNPRLDHATVLAALIGEVDLLASRNKFADALERADVAIEYWKSAGSPMNARVIWLFGAIGNAASSLGDAVRGEAAYRDAIALSERIHSKPHADTAWFVGLLGSYLVSLGRADDAEEHVMRGLQMRRDLLGEADRNTLFAVAAAARLRLAQRRKNEALELLDHGIATCADNGLENEACVRLLQTRARVRSQERAFDLAESDMNEAIRMQLQVTGDDGARGAAQLVYLAEIQRRKGDYGVAIATADDALARMQAAGGGYWADEAMARLQRAWANLELGRYQPALDEITPAEQRFSQASPNNVATRATMLAVKARALAGLGRGAEAAVVAGSARDLAGKSGAHDGEVMKMLERLAGESGTR